MPAFFLTGLDGRSDFRQDYIRLQKMLDTLPVTMVRDAMVGAGGIAIKKALPVLKSTDFGFTDRSGRLRRSIRTRQRRNFGKRTGKTAISIAYAIAGGARAYYALWVHEGHEGPRPAPEHPFLEQALDASRQAIFRTFADAMAGRIPPVVRREARKAGLRTSRAPV